MITTQIESTWQDKNLAQPYCFAVYHKLPILGLVASLFYDVIAKHNVEMPTHSQTLLVIFFVDIYFS